MTDLPPRTALIEGHRDGETYEVKFDLTRLNRQARAVYDLMRDGRWRTLSEIEHEIGEPQPSISARLRDLRKVQFGCHKIERRRRGDRIAGCFEYRIFVLREAH